MKTRLPLGLVLLLPCALSCSWARSSGTPGPRPYLISEVHQAPRLLYCLEHRFPRIGEIYENSVEVEFDVTTDGLVTNAIPVEDGDVVSTSASTGEAISRVRSCRFTPGQHWGRSVTVRMRLWMVW